MTTSWNMLIWRQFGAALDMLGHAIQSCPAAHWQDHMWDAPDDPRYGEFWFVSYHAVVWTDRYLAGSPKDFKPPAPFVRGVLPEKPYTKEQVLAYLAAVRAQCRAMAETLTDEKGAQRCELPCGEEISFAELQLYNLRHVQEHASQLGLHLGPKADPPLDWIAWAEERPA